MNTDFRSVTAVPEPKSVPRRVGPPCYLPAKRLALSEGLLPDLPFSLGCIAAHHPAVRFAECLCCLLQ